jgi:hypothetical protein
MGARKSMSKDKSMDAVTVGLTAEETPATAWMPATSWTRARSWTPPTTEETPASA